jgi:hypothetical protein
MLRLLAWIGSAVLILILGLLAYGYREATSDPVVRVAQVEVSGIQAPLRLLFISDSHVQAPDMPPKRLARIMRHLDGLHPDLVLVGGDYTGDKSFGSKVAAKEAIAPFGYLHPRLGMVAVLGNHDADEIAEVRRAFGAIGAQVLVDSAEQFGPVAVGGVWQRPRKTFRKLLRLRGVKIALSHYPDAIEKVPPEVDLTLAGHTHCGQILLPVLGPIFTGTRLQDEFICGFKNYSGEKLIVTAGLGTSHLPLRFGARPDVWLIILRPRVA